MDVQAVGVGPVCKRLGLGAADVAGAEECLGLVEQGEGADVHPGRAVVADQHVAVLDQAGGPLGRDDLRPGGAVPLVEVVGGDGLSGLAGITRAGVEVAVAQRGGGRLGGGEVKLVDDRLLPVHAAQVGRAAGDRQEGRTPHVGDVVDGVVAGGGEDRRQADVGRHRRDGEARDVDRQRPGRRQVDVVGLVVGEGLGGRPGVLHELVAVEVLAGPDSEGQGGVLIDPQVARPACRQQQPVDELVEAGVVGRLAGGDVVHLLLGVVGARKGVQFGIAWAQFRHDVLLVDLQLKLLGLLVVAQGRQPRGRGGGWSDLQVYRVAVGHLRAGAAGPQDDLVGARLAQLGLYFDQVSPHSEQSGAERPLPEAGGAYPVVAEASLPEGVIAEGPPWHPGRRDLGRGHRHVRELTGGVVGEDLEHLARSPVRGPDHLRPVSP